MSARVGILRTDELSPRQHEVLALAAMGLSDKEIAGFLGIGEETVKTRIRQILGKLGARTRAHAVAVGFRRGILS